jgi:hypothetical protein
MYPRMALELGSAEPTLGTAGRRGDALSRCEDVWCTADKAAILSTQTLDSRNCVMLTSSLREVLQCPLDGNQENFREVLWRI